MLGLWFWRLLSILRGEETRWQGPLCTYQTDTLSLLLKFRRVSLWSQRREQTKILLFLWQLHVTADDSDSGRVTLSPPPSAHQQYKGLERQRKIWQKKSHDYSCIQTKTKPKTKQKKILVYVPLCKLLLNTIHMHCIWIVVC